jgi:hypothetical protein
MWPHRSAASMTDYMSRLFPTHTRSCKAWARRPIRVSSRVPVPVQDDTSYIRRYVCVAFLSRLSQDSNTYSTVRVSLDAPSTTTLVASCKCLGRRPQTHFCLPLARHGAGLMRRKPQVTLTGCPSRPPRHMPRGASLAAVRRRITKTCYLPLALSNAVSG